MPERAENAETKLCPMLNQGKSVGFCLEEKCAWWIHLVGACAVRVMGVAMGTAKLGFGKGEKVEDKDIPSKAEGE